MTLRTNRIELADGSKGVTTNVVLSGSAKVWANWNTTGFAELDSYNVSSFTDKATGQTTIGFTNSLVNATYAAQADYDQIHNAPGGCGGAVQGRTVNSCLVIMIYDQTYFDWTSDNLMVHGELA